MQKDKVIAFTIADSANLPYAEMMIKSFHKFHPDIEVKIYEGRPVKDFFYKATPLIMSELIKEYELVIKIDADSIITGNLDYVLNSKYDVGTVLNWNQVDPLIYGEVGVCTITPKEYYNNGFVACRSERFIKNWLSLCNGKHFDRMPMREQGFLNILAHYGDYFVKCFDDYDPLNKYSAWHGLASKGEWLKIKVKGDELVLLANGYPDRDKKIKVIHWGAGGNEPKMNYRNLFTEEVIEFLDKQIE